MSSWLKPCLLVGAVLAAWAPMAVAQPAVAGLHPDRRPDSAPQLTTDDVSADRLKAYLHGVSEPVPGNVGTIAGTGHWWVPLRHPGMTGPYDVRAWHTGAAPAAAATPTVAPASAASR